MSRPTAAPAAPSATAAAVATAHLRKYLGAVAAQRVAVLEQAHALLTPWLGGGTIFIHVLAASLGHLRLDLGNSCGPRRITGAGARGWRDLDGLIGDFDIGAIAQAVGAVHHHRV